MAFLIITAMVLIPTFLFLFIGSKMRDKFVFEKVGNEGIVDVNDAVKFLRRNEKTAYDSGVLYLTNRRLIFFKYRFNWLGIIPFIGEAFISIFIDKNILVEIPLYQIANYTFKGKITYYNNRSQNEGITTFYTKDGEEIQFDIYTLELINNKKPDILIALDRVVKTLDNPNAFVPNTQ
ncbi:MAG TPA: hypothetical protein PK431_09365 [Chitinophagales bacterium]|nr:hypothetical protein [Chitinophagales bacterium]